jgi:2-dehydropantoate 2-reductase
MKDAARVDPASFVIVSALEEALRYGPFDVALFALKSFDTQSALEGIKPYAEKMPPVLCLSNGVSNEPAIASALGKDKVIYGTVTSAIGRRGAGDIVLERLRGVGVAKGHPLSEKLHNTFNAAYLNSQLFDDAHSMKWSKMLTNLIANPTSAILDMTAGEVFADRGLYKLEIEMLRECLAVMDAQEFHVVDLPGTPVRALAFATKLPLWLSRPILSRAAGAGRGAKMPSFHIDLHSGRRKSEVEYLHGEVVRAGQKCNVPTPVNKVLTETLLALTNKDIPLEEFAHKPEKLLSKFN